MNTVITTLTRNYFNAMAEKWDTKVIPDAQKVCYLLKQLDLLPQQTILDLGCGTGVLFPFVTTLTSGNARLVAVDFAPGMVFEAKKKNNGLANVCCADAEQLPFAGQQFDRVVAFNVFPHIENKIQALKESWRVLKPGGEIGIIHTRGSGELNAFHHSLGGVVKAHTLPSGRQMYSFLQMTRFQVVKVVDKTGSYIVRGMKPVYN